MKKTAKRYKLPEMQPFAPTHGAGKRQKKETSSKHPPQGQIFPSLGVFGGMQTAEHQSLEPATFEVPTHRLKLPDAVWQMLDLASQNHLPHAQGSGVTFYRYKGHLCLASSQSLLLLETSTQTNIFRHADTSHNRAAFHVVLNVSEAELKHILEQPRGDKNEPEHNLEQLEDLLLLASQVVRSRPTWEGVRDWLHHEVTSLGWQPPVALVKQGNWRMVSGLIYGDIYGMF
jgi:hypothetical protein